VVTAARTIYETGAKPARYRVVTTLGSGGTALVYLAIAERSAGFQKLVVLKTLLGHLANEPSVADMFRNEARISARLKHPNVVEVYEVLDDVGDHPVLVMEYLRGACLRDLVKHGENSLPLRHHLDIIRQSCRGLHHCHELKDFDGTPMHFIHRDVSPHNIYVTFEGEVRLLDFGIAKVQGHDGGTQTGLLKGKIRYMAPEQMMGEALDRRADIYAIGVALWEALAGREMWTGQTEGMILHRSVNADLPPMDPLVAGATPEMVEITMRCLAVDRNDRYATTEEIADDLDRVLRDMPEPQRRLGQVVQSLFSDRDEAVHALVRSALATPSNGPTFEGGVIDWGEALGESRTGSFDTRSLHSRATRDSRLTPSPALTQPGSNRMPRVLATLGVVAAAAIAGTLAYAPWTPPPTPLSTLPSSVVGTPVKERFAIPVQTALQSVRPFEAMSPIASAPTAIALRVQVSPSSARVFLDGELLEDPSDLSRPADGKPHMLRVVARGFADYEQSLVFNQDHAVSVNLSRKSAHRGSPHGAAEPTPVQPADTPAATAPEPTPEPSPSKKKGILGLEEECKRSYVIRKDGLLGDKRAVNPACK